MQNDPEMQQLRSLLAHNTELIEENNSLLKKLYRNSVVGFWFRLLWYVVLLGVPLAIYYYVLQPYLHELGTSYQTFNASVQQIPGWKEFVDAVNAINTAHSQH